MKTGNCAARDGMKQNGKTCPATTRPEPSMNCVMAGICRCGSVNRIPKREQKNRAEFHEVLK